MTTQTLTRLDSIEIDPRFNGPKTSANGGYAAGTVARYLPEPAEVTLRMPPPLGAPLDVVAVDQGVQLLDGESLIAEARPGVVSQQEIPARPSFEEALAARAAHPGNGIRHPLSDCVVCGPERATPGDGLGVCPGTYDEARDISAAPFAPDASLAVDGIVDPAVVWAALDCPSYVPSMWAGMADGRISLLGRMTALRERAVTVGEHLVVVGWPRGTEGRKRFTSSAVIDALGEVVARADATWIQLADRGGRA